MKYTSFKMTKSVNSHNWENGCHACKKPFQEDETFVRYDVQTSPFRGDDEVYCFHTGCTNGWERTIT